MLSHGPSKPAWTNKFQTPTVQMLRDGYPKAVHGVIDAARAALNDLEGIDETVAWNGVPWRWTLVYHVHQPAATPRGRRVAAATGGPPPRPMAYLIPDPTRLQLCVPLTREQIAGLPIRRFKKSVRDGIVFARAVAGVSWPTWDLPSRAAVEDVSDLLRRKHRMLAPSTDALAAGA